VTPFLRLQFNFAFWILPHPPCSGSAPAGSQTPAHLLAYAPPPVGWGRKWEEQEGENLGVGVKTGKSLSSYCHGQNRLRA